MTLLTNENYKNKREFVRLKTSHKLAAVISIIGIGKRQVQSKELSVCLEDVSGNGLAFISNLDIPVEREVTFAINFRLLETDLEFQGLLVRKTSIASNTKYIYGVHLQDGTLDSDGFYKLLMKTGKGFCNVNEQNSSMWNHYLDICVPKKKGRVLK